MKDLTSIQQVLLTFLQEHLREGLPAPTYRELCQKFGWTSTATARDHLKALEKKGYIHLAHGRARSVSMVQSMNPHLLEFSFSLQGYDKEIGNLQILKNNPHYCAVRVADYGLQNYGVDKGDLAVVNMEKNCQNGDIVLVKHEQKYSFNKWYQQDERPALLYDPVTDTQLNWSWPQVHIIGVVMGFIKYFDINSHDSSIGSPRTMRML